MSHKWRERGDRLTFTAAQAYTKGVLYIHNGIPGIALNTYASGEEAVFAIGEVWELPFNASDTATRGKVAYWDASAGELVDAPNDTDCTPVGVFWNTSTGSTAEVLLGAVVDGVLTLEHAFADGATLDLSAFAGPYDIVLTVDTAAGAVEVDLPSVTNMQGRRVTIIRGGSGINAITVDQDGTETINGSGTANTSLDTEHDVLTLVANSPTGWIIESSVIA